MLENLVHEAKANGAILGGGIGVALLQYGMHNPNLKSTMEVYVDIIGACVFAH